MQTSCAVCAEAVAEERLAACPHCAFAACRACVRTYLLGRDETEHCMRCFASWSRVTLVDACSASWVASTYRAHREEVLHAAELRRAPEVLGGGLRRSPATQAEEPAPRACPSIGCDGTLLGSDRGTCTRCGTRVCGACLAAVPPGSGDHACRADDLLTAAVVERATVACPKCGVRTERSEGCNEMWCTMCHTWWDWQSGRAKSEYARGHNPHFREWQLTSNVAANLLDRVLRETPCSVRSTALLTCLAAVEAAAAPPADPRGVRRRELASRHALLAKHLSGELDARRHGRRLYEMEKRTLKRAHVAGVLAELRDGVRGALAASRDDGYAATAARLERLRTDANSSLLDAQRAFEGATFEFDERWARRSVPWGAAARRRAEKRPSPTH